MAGVLSVKDLIITFCVAVSMVWIKAKSPVTLYYIYDSPITTQIQQITSKTESVQEKI